MKFLNYLIGNMPFQTFLAAMFFALVGQLLFKRMTYTAKPEKKKPHNPSKFNIWYWLRDNAFDMCWGLLANYALVIFAKDIVRGWHPEWLPYFENAETMTLFAVIGFCQAPIWDQAKKAVRILRGKR